mmetsp:Transcript_27133/g.85401  ORF Transcript_27133/g.85401 Transcript_27133/m.85401 type:complete len:154 (-) Transcript_27133:504-965(-)
MLLNFLSAGGAATVSKAAAKADWANNIDLNRASNEIVNKAKEDMDEAFQRSRITKDDPNWVYDKEVQDESQSTAGDCTTSLTLLPSRRSTLAMAKRTAGGIRCRCAGGCRYSIPPWRDGPTLRGAFNSAPSHSAAPHRVLTPGWIGFGGTIVV